MPTDRSYPNDDQLTKHEPEKFKLTLESWLQLSENDKVDFIEHKWKQLEYEERYHFQKLIWSHLRDSHRHQINRKNDLLWEEGKVERDRATYIAEEQQMAQWCEKMKREREKQDKKKADSFAERFLCSEEVKHRELIPGLLRSGMQMGLGGPLKCCKTSTSILMAANLITGTSFLGLKAGPVCRVAVLTLETSKNDWINRFEMAVDNCDQSKCEGRPVESLYVFNERNILTKKPHRYDLKCFLKDNKVDVMVLDPWYQISPKANSSDIVGQGRALRQICAPIREAGATPVLLHHFNKSIEAGSMPTLADLSGAAVGPFVRSWLLLNRETPYRPGKPHELLGLLGTLGTSAEMRIRFDEEKWSFSARPLTSELKVAAKKKPSLKDLNKVGHD